MSRGSRRWRSWLTLQSLRWPVLAVLLVVGLVLGYIGISEQDAGAGPLDVLYANLRMLALGEGPVEANNLETEIARFLLPAVAASSALIALAAIFRDRFTEFRASLLRDHMIIVGCGEAGAGLALLARSQGRSVIVVDLGNAESHDLAACRAAGVHTITGDGTSPAVLQRARLAQARDLVALCGDDEANSAIAVLATKLPRRERLRIVVRVRSPGVAAMLRAYQLHREQRDVVLDVFELERMVAPILLARIERSRPRTVALFGDSALWAHLLQEWRYRRRSAGGTHVQRMVVMTGRPPSRDLGEAADVVWLTGDPTVSAVSPPSAICDAEVMCIRHRGDGSTLATAMLLSETMEDRTELIAALARPLPVGELISGGFETLNLLEAIVTPQQLDGATIDRLAQAIHERYVAARRADEGDPPEAISLLPWEQLPQDLRESNRDQAASIGVKLATIGVGLVPAVLADPSFEFSSAEVEVLAEMEHERWVAERGRSGWQLGPTRDVAARRTPSLVSWARLPDPVRELDREAVRAIPELVDRAGFKLVRSSTAAEGDGGTRRS